MAQLREELEASCTEVARLQSMLRGDDIRSSAVAEYLQSAAYRRRVEFERAHHSQSGYVRALSDVAALYPEVDLSRVLTRSHPLRELARPIFQWRSGKGSSCGGLERDALFEDDGGSLMLASS
ncbi:hypothetical protein ACLOJK_004666 [Asimina triloba]